jgi:WD40 repeat protein
MSDISLNADSRHLATCSADSTVKIWSTVNFEYTPEKTLTGHQRWVWDAAFSADSAYLVTGKFNERNCAEVSFIGPQFAPVGSDVW